MISSYALVSLSATICKIENVLFQNYHSNSIAALMGDVGNMSAMPLINHEALWSIPDLLALPDLLEGQEVEPPPDGVIFSRVASVYTPPTSPVGPLPISVTFSDFVIPHPFPMALLVPAEEIIVDEPPDEQMDVQEIPIVSWKVSLIYQSTFVFLGPWFSPRVVGWVDWTRSSNPTSITGYFFLLERKPHPRIYLSPKPQ